MARPALAPLGVFVGTHYEYPFGGSSRRAEWRPRGPSDWLRDLTAIRDTGFNLIRIRIGFDSDLDEVAGLLDLAHEVDLKVDFGFATFYAPDWFTEQYPDSRIVTAEGETLGSPRDRRWPRVCIEHPAFRAAWRKLLDASARHFHDHPAVILWDVHNEPKYVCFCARSRANFAAFLEARYGSVAALNSAWGSDHPDFDACTAAPSKSEGGRLMGADSHYGAWRIYQSTTLSDFLDDGFKLIRAHVRDRPVTYNVALSLDDGSDWWTTRQSDVAALSEYWGSDAWTVNRSVRLALLAGLNPGKQLWALETQGGMAPKFFMPTLWTGKHLELETWALLARGAKGIVQYRWEPLLAENETMMFSMVDVASNDTEKRRRMTEVNACIREIAPFLAAARPPEPQVTLYLPRDTYVQASLKYPAAVSLYPLGYAPSPTLDGWYGLLTHAGFATDILCETPTPLLGGRVLVVPFTEFLSEAEWAALEAHRAVGGRAILQLPAGDEVAAARVSARLGFICEEAEVRPWNLDGWALFRQDGSNVGAAYTRRVTLARLKAEASLAHFHDNGRPALIQAGGGRWLVASFDIGHSYDLMLHKALRIGIASWIEAAGCSPHLRIDGIDEDYRPLVEVRLLENGGEALVIACNRSPYAWDVTIHTRCHAPVPAELPAFEARQILLGIAGAPRRASAGRTDTYNSNASVDTRRVDRSVLLRA